jgi:alkyldihydroxyacetonephosphate synthase
VRASGEVVRIAPFPRTSIGPSLRELFLGSEGTLGVITEVTFRIHPLPETRALTSFGFPGMKEALEASRRVLRVGWRPAVLRAYDATEAHRHFTEDRCVLIAVSEGPATLVAAEMEAVRRDCVALGGVEIGEKHATHWMKGRNEVPSWDFFIDREMLADTIEVAVTWDRIDALYEQVRTALAESPGVVLATGHSSHGYQQGTNIYFTFVMKPEDFSRAEEAYLTAWGNAMKATLAVGGTIAHHHGIGRLRAPFLAEELGSGYPLLRDLKRALDPKGIMNPGTLLA